MSSIKYLNNIYEVAMKSKAFIIIFITLFCLPISAQGQKDQSYPSRFMLTESADVLHNFSLFGRLGTGLFTRDVNVIQGQVSIGLADFFELTLLRSESAVNFYGVPQTLPQWGFKFRVLDGSAQLPAVSFVFRNSLDWKLQEFFGHHIAVQRPAFAREGLNGTRYRLRLSSATLVATQRVLSRIEITGGLGIQEIQTKDLWIFMSPAPSVTNGFHDADIEYTLMLSGLFQARADISGSMLVFVEAQSVPMIAPDLVRLSLDFQRGYLTTVGVRLIPLFPMSMDVMISHQTPFMQVSHTEFRISLGILMGPS